MVSRIVWHLVSNRWNSAVTEFAISAARALEGLGYQNIISPKNQSPAHNLALRHGFLVKPLEDFKFKRVPRLLKLKQDIKPDILIVYGWHETFLSKFLMSREVKIFRFRGHEGGPLKRGMLDQWAQRWAHSHVTGLVAPSYISQRAWSKLTPSRPMVPITLGKDTGRYRYCRLKVLERPRLMILGRLDPIKGHRHFLQIFRLLLNNWDPSLPKPQLEIVGEEQNISYAELEGWVCNAGLKSGDDVILTKGRVPLEGVFERASLGVICSLGSEFICRVGEEFLLSGTPIVVSGVGSLEDLLFEGAGVTYRGLSIDDSAQLVAHCLKVSMFEGEEARKKRARRAEDRFSLGVMGQSLHSFICVARHEEFSEIEG